MANTLDLINASAGTGEAVRANVTIARSAGATIITVDSVANWPAKFVATAGKIVGTALTTPLVFAGHISGTTIVIDTIASGYTDAGNAVGDVLVLKPSTLWADNIAGFLAAAHNNDGTIINQTITAPKIAANAITSAQIQSGSLNYATLLGSIFSSQVQSYANTGAGGGTGYYVNLGGIKIAWGLTGGIGGIGPNSTTATNAISLPSPFFSTIQSASITIFAVGSAAQQYIVGNNFTATNLGWYITNNSNATVSAQLSWIVIGT